MVMVCTVRGRGLGLDRNLERHLSSAPPRLLLRWLLSLPEPPTPSPSNILVDAALLKLITREERKRKVPSFYAAEASGKVT